MRSAEWARGRGISDRRAARHMTLDRREFFPVVHAVTDSATVTHDHFLQRAPKPSCARWDLAVHFTSAPPSFG